MAEEDTTAIVKISAKESARISKERKWFIKDSIRAVKDSIKEHNDSVKWSKPRILETYVFVDSLKYQRMVVWNHDSKFNSIQVISPDTTFNDNYLDYPFFSKDVGASYLGISGSAAQFHNYFKRETLPIFDPFAPYLTYSYTKETLPFYNVKSPYTELAYNGTLFANRDKEESNLKIMHTQNLSPSFNLNFTYKRYGAAGQLPRESTDNRTVAITSNYIGNRYVMHGGYIYQGIKRDENGGILSDHIVLDSIVEDSKDLEYRLKEADNQLKRNTLFLTHSYGIPIKWSKGDTLREGQGTITYFGHTFELSTYSKKYTDNIGQEDSIGRALYNNIFIYSPEQTYDSTRVNSIENSFFIRIQPWAQSAVISKLDGGVGHQLMEYYNFVPENFLHGQGSRTFNNLFLYFGGEGNFKRYFKWDAYTRYHLAGYYQGDLSANAKVRLSLFPIEGGINLTGALSLEQRHPSWFESSYFSNHYFWNNNFDKITETKIEGSLDIPKFKLLLWVGYSAINNPIYYGVQGFVAQHKNTVSIFSASLQKNFKIGFLHLDNRVLFQMSSNREIIPLPEISANLKYYLQFELVKDVLSAQLGANATYTTEWYAPAYSPALGIFHNQNDRLIGNYPYIDAFVNLQWKRASIYVKYLNLTQGWPDGDYFSAHHFIRPLKALKFGIHWPFYVK